MHDIPLGVVDANCRFTGWTNLFVAGASCTRRGRGESDTDPVALTSVCQAT